MARSVEHKKVAWVVGASMMMLGMACGGDPLQAADKVVVIPLGKSGSPAPAAKTGQTVRYAVGDDGDLEKGVGMASGRFVDNANGTVTDNLTGLIWLKEGQCTEFFSGDTNPNNARPWTAAITAANLLADGYCELSDGSTAGDWRLPNFNELNSLIDRGRYRPALPANCPLAESTASLASYWTSTTKVSDTRYAWLVYLYDGYSYPGGTKTNSYYVRAVRGGQ